MTEDLRALSRHQLVLKCQILEIENRALIRQCEEYKLLFRSTDLADHAASHGEAEATTETDAHALPAAAAGGYGQQVQAPALPARRNPGPVRGHRPGMAQERSQTRGQAGATGNFATTTMYVCLPFSSKAWTS